MRVNGIAWCVLQIESAFEKCFVVRFNQIYTCFEFLSSDRVRFTLCAFSIIVQNIHLHTFYIGTLSLSHSLTLNFMEYDGDNLLFDYSFIQYFPLMMLLLLLFFF